MPHTEADTAALPDAKRSPRAIWWLLGGAALALPVVLYLAWFVSLSQPIEAELEAIRAAGHPATAAEVEAWHAYPDGPNPADALLAAFRHIRLPVYTSAGGPELEHLPLVYAEPDLPPPGEPLPAPMAETIERVLADNAEALERLHEAADLQVREARYPVDFSDGITALMPHLQPLRRAGGLLAIEAVAHAEAGRPEAAARSLRAALRIAASLEREPVLISQRVRVAIQSGVVDVLERTVQGQIDDGTLAELIDALAAAEQVDAHTPALIAERAAMNDLFRQGWRGKHLDVLGPNVFENPWESFRYYISGDWHEDHRTYLDVVAEHIAAARLPLPKRIEGFEKAKDKLLAYSTARPPAPTRMSQAMLPNYVRAARDDLRAIARLRAARTALAAERYRLAHGRPPDRLEDLAGTFLDAIPADPFTGQPLRYRREPGRFTVYSVGEDRTDHGGARTNPAGERYEPGADIPFTLYRD